MKPADPKPKLAYTYKEAAVALGVCEKTLKRAVATQKIEYCRIGTSVRFTQQQLNDYLAAHVVKRIVRPSTKPREVWI